MNATNPTDDVPKIMLPGSETYWASYERGAELEKRFPGQEATDFAYAIGENAQETPESLAGHVMTAAARSFFHAMSGDLHAPDGEIVNRREEVTSDTNHARESDHVRRRGSAAAHVRRRGLQALVTDTEEGSPAGCPSRHQGDAS